MDGVDTRDYNISWLRSQIGVVSQEPSLFAASIRENIRFGRDDCTDEDIIAAAMEASVDTFVQKLPLVQSRTQSFIHRMHKLKYVFIVLSVIVLLFVLMSQIT